MAPFFKTYLLLICMIPAMAGCVTTVSVRTDLAAETATATGMRHVEFKARPFVLTGWERVAHQGAPVHIYIEGDGLAWLGRGRISPNPTPKQPVALELAAQDTSYNVVYLARPCQNTPFNIAGNEACSDSAYWAGKRFSQEVINSYMITLDDIATRAGTKEFYILGYSGGANIAGLLAARRTDITRLVTVAGNIDNDYFTQFHKVSAMPNSLNMADDARRLSHIPQMHLVGGKDKIVPIDIYRSYTAKMGNTSCTRHQLVPNATHNHGWESARNILRNIRITC